MEYKKLITTARLTGFWYLLLAISGVLGFLMYHPQIFVSGNPQKTLTNLIDFELTARIRLLLEVAIIASQALAAIWFYRLFREINAWAAFAMSSWGLMNAAAIMISAVSMSTAIHIAHLDSPTFQEKVLFIQLLSIVISKSWAIGGLFFGLWLLPMGYVILSSKRMPSGLGWTLLIGGVGYILSTFLNSLGLSHPLMGILTMPATVGEFWMIGYLLIYEIRPLASIEQR